MPLLLALTATASLVLGLRGLVLTRSNGLTLHFLDQEEGEVRRGPRRTIFGRLLEALDRVVGRRAVGSATDSLLARADVVLARAGYPQGFTAERLIARQASWGAIGALPAVLLLLNGQFLALLIPLLAALFPRWLVWSAARRRQLEIERSLPDFLDVLTVTISAGLGFRAALSRVAEATGGAVGQEVSTALRQIDLGSSRRRAFEQLRDRNNSKALGHFVTAFLQSEELGSPLRDFLASYAAEMRTNAGQRAKTAAARANPKISVVITMVIIPAITIFLIGSLVISVFQRR